MPSSGSWAASRSFNPGKEVGENNWLYRLAKQHWFNDFGFYRGRDHHRESAPAILGRSGSRELTRK
jgi:hypothetical protein